MKNHLTEHAGQCKTVGVDRRLVIVALPLKLVQSEAGVILSFFFSSFFFPHGTPTPGIRWKSFLHLQMFLL